jgi:hypothetical protein
VNPQALVSQPWRKSSYSDTARQCVEVAQAGQACLVRDTANRSGQQLSVGRPAWTAFTRRMRSGGLPSSPSE